MKKNLLITGKPGCGKTTLIKKIVQLFPDKFGGFYTEEIRERGKRKGFKVCSLSGKEEIFADIDYVSPFRVSKYGVNLRIFESIGVEAINEAMRTSKIIVIDEIGKMELFSEKFKETLIRALDSKKKVLATITLSNIDFVNKIKRRSDCDIIFLSRENFDFNLNKIRKWVLIGEVK